MSYNLHQHPRKEEQISILLAGAAVVFVWVFGMSTWAVAQKAASPATLALRQCAAKTPSAKSDSKIFSSGPGFPNAQYKRIK